MTNFQYKPIFVLSDDKTEYKIVTKEHISVKKVDNRSILYVDPLALTILAKQAIIEVSHLQRKKHLKSLCKIIDAPDASENDRYIAQTLLNNAVIASKMVYPICQDTGTAIVIASKGEDVYTGVDDSEFISYGIWQAYKKANLRYSQMSPISMYKEVNTKTNLPAQIDISATTGNEYKFLIITKGGGSANKTYLFQQSKEILTPKNLIEFLKDRISEIGTSACPPYHLAVVIGGSSPEMNLKTVKLASAKYYDNLPEIGSIYGSAFRDKTIEKVLLAFTKEIGIGAQFGGRYFCHDVRVIRLPRHGASCPIGIGLSCSADRNIKAKINKDGIFLEKLEDNPEKYISHKRNIPHKEAVNIELSTDMAALRAELSKYPVGTRIMLSGKMIVARDIAHYRLKEKLSNSKRLPDYMKDYIIFYAGPSKTPSGQVCGSIGPTTASRMDSYIPIFQNEGASLVTLAKGNRSKIVVDSCKKNGGFYLGTIGGAAALLGRECVRSIKLIEYADLGMEAVYMIDVVKLPAFILIDDKGNSFN